MKVEKDTIKTYTLKLCHQVVCIGRLNLTVVNGLAHHTRNGKQQIEDDEQPKKEEPDNKKDELIADLSLELLQTQEELEATQEDVANLTLTIMGGSVNA